MIVTHNKYKNLKVKVFSFNDNKTFSGRVIYSGNGYVGGRTYNDFKNHLFSVIIPLDNYKYICNFSAMLDNNLQNICE